MAGETSPMEFDQENQLAMVVVDQPAKAAEPRFYEGTMWGLPRGWAVEIRPRKASSKYHGKVDQFFYEPETRRQFRSLKAVKKHLGIDGGQTSSQKKPKTTKSTNQFESFIEKENYESKAAGHSANVSEKVKDDSSGKFAKEENEEGDYHNFDKIAKRVKWQLLNGEKNKWDMFVKVPDIVQERWMDLFLKPDIFS